MKINTILKHKQLAFVRYIEIPFFIFINSIGLLHENDFLVLMERWENINRKATLENIRRRF